MALRIVWSPTPRLDLRDFATYIAESDPVAARKFVQGISQAVERLRDSPQSGRMVPELSDPAIREVIRRPCRIVCRFKAAQQSIEIARIWHAARGIPEI